MVVVAERGGSERYAIVYAVYKFNSPTVLGVSEVGGCWGATVLRCNISILFGVQQIRHCDSAQFDNFCDTICWCYIT